MAASIAASNAECVGILERRKYLDETTTTLWKFCGIRSVRNGKLRTRREAVATVFTPEPLAFNNGFLLTPEWIEGTQAAMHSTEVLLDTMA